MATGGTKCKIVPGAGEPSLRGKETQTSWGTIPYSRKKAEQRFHILEKAQQQLKRCFHILEKAAQHLDRGFHIL